MKGGTSQRALMEKLRGRFSAALEPSGFLPYEEGWRLRRSPLLACVEPRLRSDGAAFRVNAGVHCDFVPVMGRGECPDDVLEPECELRTRLSGDGREKWWPLSADSVDESQELLLTQGLAWVAERSDPAKLVDGLSSAEISGARGRAIFANLTEARRFLLAARIREHYGDTRGAKAAAEARPALGPPAGPKVQLKRRLARMEGRESGGEG